MIFKVCRKRACFVPSNENAHTYHNFYNEKPTEALRSDRFLSYAKLDYLISEKYLIVLTIWLVYEFSLSYHETT